MPETLFKVGPDTFTTVRIPAALYAALEAAPWRKGRLVGELVEVAIAAYLRHNRDRMEAL